MSEQVKILCVDDEKNVLKALERIFLDDDFEIMTGNSGEEGLGILDLNPDIQVVISDYRMPGMNGVEFLREVYTRRPDTVRMVLSGYADTASIVAAINEGQIYKFIPKPWNDDELRMTVIKAIETFTLAQNNRELAEQLITSNEGLERLVAERTAELILQNRALNHAQNVLRNLPVGVLAIVADDVVIQVNDEAAALIGIPVEMILAEKYQMVLPEPIVSFIANLFADGASICSSIDVRGQRLQIRGIRMEEDGQGALIIVLDKQFGEESPHG
jgi:two-component system NtrC family sensor kinase